MTKIIITRRQGKIIGFTAESHSGYAEEGSDIVCSAISALTQSAILGLEQVAKVEPTYEIGEAYLSCSIVENLSPQARERADMVLETMAIGLESIKQGYSENLNITNREV